MPVLLPPGKLPVPQSRDLSPANLTHGAARKPLDAVLGRIALLLVMFAGALILIALPLSYVLAEWEAAAGAIGLVLIYGGVSYFLRPRQGGNWDPSAAEENSAVVRYSQVALDRLCIPGRFAANTLLEACALLGLAARSDLSSEEEPAVKSAAFPLGHSKYSQEFRPQ